MAGAGSDELATATSECKPSGPIATTLPPASGRTSFMVAGRDVWAIRVPKQIGEYDLVDV